MVVPTYNDLESLKILLRLIDEQQSKKVGYLIVNNGSNDARIEELLSKESLYWTHIYLPVNLGFGGGILEGIKAAKTKWIGWMPGNLKIQPVDVEKLVSNLYLEPQTFVKSRRKRKSRSAKIKTFFAGVIQSLLTGRNLFDTGGTPTICEKDFILKLDGLPSDYVIESRMLFEARKHKMKVIRPTIPYGERVHGSSHWQKGVRSEIALMHKIWTSAKTWKND